MKKQMLATSLLIMALGLSACSPKAPAETTPAETTTSAAAETTTAAETETSEEEVEEVSVDGVITKIEADVVTIKNSEDDTEASYDISKAEVIGDYELSVGDEVEVTFAEGSAGDVISAISLEVYTSVIEENSDPKVSGSIEKSENDTLSLKTEDGETYTFSTANSYVVSKDGMKAGVNAEITYLGDLEDTDPIPMAIKVVTEDSFDSEDAKINAFKGTIDQLTGNDFTAETADGNYFSCTAEEGVDLSSFNKGDTVLITYAGPLTAKVIAVTNVEK
ncbi:hypothetical protein C0033_24515 [Clostridium sp. chh4-2]|uniref:hypothetical protein n=1 Tax=Clostridium sp. chh4-2 TaxID=2067550 RepID=UPI000CCDDF97|nr:hypothetical protein [Clostridium sp. chh4-2]PNV59311.1 hypothetical protein C0033_24515 [Clostridium sp. chh4-2]